MLDPTHSQFSHFLRTLGGPRACLTLGLQSPYAREGYPPPRTMGCLHKASYTFAGPLKHMVPPAADGNVNPLPSSSRGGGRLYSICHAPRWLASPDFTRKGQYNEILLRLLFPPRLPYYLTLSPLNGVYICVCTTLSANTFPMYICMYFCVFMCVCAALCVCV